MREISPNKIRHDVMNCSLFIANPWSMLVDLSMWVTQYIPHHSNSIFYLIRGPRYNYATRRDSLVNVDASS